MSCLLTLTVGCIAGVAIAGCGGSSGSAGGGGVKTGASSATASSSATSAAAPAAPSAAAGVAKPGTTLTIGQTATVPYKSSTAPYSAPPTGQLRITISGVTHAPASDFKGVQLNASEKASDMYYVRYAMANVGTGDANSGNTGGPSVVVKDSSGQDASSVTILGDFPACKYNLTPKPFNHGASWSNCEIYDAPGGIAQVTYTGNVPAYFTAPVVWK